MSYVFDYANTTPITTDAEYPYVAEVGSCTYNEATASPVMMNDDSAVNVSWTAEDWKTNLKNGVIAMAVSASNPHFMSYQSGILDTDDCNARIDHAVAMVGWGIDAETNAEYWIIKNSWGTTWGEGGYIRIAMRESGEGVC